SAARRLAQGMSEGKTETVRAEGFSYFQFSRADDHVVIFPRRGHVVEIDYPAEAHGWKDTDLDVLIDMEPIRHESPPALHDTLRRLAEGTDEVVLATDYDREGELIGVEALETLRGQRPDLPARRARFSAMSPSEVRRAFETLTEPDWALAQAAAARQRIDPAWGPGPTPLLAKASREGISASRGMLAAQDLYVHGEISYPRTDNTVYPSSLPVHEILGRLRESAYGPYAERLLAQPSLEPSRGPIQTTDHPPVYPTAAPAKRRDSVRSRVYDLVARRFLATLSPASVTAVTEVRLTVGDSAFLAIGRKILDPGWREILPEPETITELPSLSEGEAVPIQEIRVVEDRTKSPPLHSQGSLLLAMQRLELGTKSTRHEILDLLFRLQF